MGTDYFTGEPIIVDTSRDESAVRDFFLDMEGDAFLQQSRGSGKCFMNSKLCENKFGNLTPFEVLTARTGYKCLDCVKM